MNRRGYFRQRTAPTSLASVITASACIIRLINANSFARRHFTPLAAAVCGLAALHIAAPAYLFGQGFPLDDAWIHAVYARELARSGVLAYNPGVPATGETSPLWAIVLAVPHAIAGASIAVLLTKLVGFAMHAASAVFIALAIRDVCGEARLLPALGGVLVALHPDLVAASVSGMEVPLATLVIGWAARPPSGRTCCWRRHLARRRSSPGRRALQSLFCCRSSTGSERSRAWRSNCRCAHSLARSSRLWWSVRETSWYRGCHYRRRFTRRPMLPPSSIFTGRASDSARSST